MRAAGEHVGHALSLQPPPTPASMSAAKAQELMEQASKTANKKPGFFGSLMGNPMQRFEDAAEMYKVRHLCCGRDTLTSAGRRFAVAGVLFPSGACFA